MEDNMKRFVWLAALLALAGSLAFAAGRQSGASTGTGVLVTLDVYSGISSGIQENRYWTEILKEDLGIVLNLLPTSTELFNAMMAAKSFNADIVGLGIATNASNAIQAGLILNLDDYRDKLPNVYANGCTMLQYVLDNVSN